ncbi:MAG TPA: phosphate acyltransferase PlsX [Solirubrobacteraceae bacterium]|nr:phosphate acyltransferase PlsX [Solirubrobacteraceae bacterium]
MRIAVDANGADLGPSEVAAGAVIALEHGITPVLFGPAERIGAVPDGVEVVDAPVSIAKVPDPARAVRATPEASIVQAARAVASGDCEALVSGGSTGPALAAGFVHIKRDRGIHRPALALPIPTPSKPVTLVDVGANVECRPEHLVQFAFMGSALAQVVLGVQRPRVGLLSNGEESSKGTDLIREAHETLSCSPGIDFAGNVEGTEIADGAVDVVVADGFTGNVTLKVIEGVSQTMMAELGARIAATPRSRLGGRLLRPSLDAWRDEIDPEGPGGAYLLGLRRLGVVPHGRFTRQGISQAILLAARGASGDVVGRTHAALERAGALRSSPAATVPEA